MSLVVAQVSQCLVQVTCALAHRRPGDSLTLDIFQQYNNNSYKNNNTEYSPLYIRSGACCRSSAPSIVHGAVGEEDAEFFELSCASSFVAQNNIQRSADRLALRALTDGRLGCQRGRLVELQQKEYFFLGVLSTY